MRDDLLPCPFCGAIELDVSSGEKDAEGTLVSIFCTDCGCVGPSMHTGDGCVNDLIVNEWNTRSIKGHLLAFKRVETGVISPENAWIVFYGGYMYGPCKDWEDVETQIRNEWEHDKHLVG